MEKKHIIYRILNLKTRKFYIGKTGKLLLHRWSVHKAHARNGEKYTKTNGKNCGMSYIYKSMRKYGIENFEIKQIDEAKNFKHCCFLEQFYIKYYNSIDSKYGYNLTINGYGDGLEFISEEARSKLRASTYKNSMSRHNGVHWDKARGKWGMKFMFGDIKISKRYSEKNLAEFDRDILSIHFYKENAILIYPEKLDEYNKLDIVDLVEKLKTKRKNKSKFL